MSFLPRPFPGMGGRRRARQGSAFPCLPRRPIVRRHRGKGRQRHEDRRRGRRLHRRERRRQHARPGRGANHPPPRLARRPRPGPRDDAAVVALKSRSVAAAEAVAQSVEAARALRAAGAEQIVFKYCSTFDSTPQGNIGPVAAALLDLLGGELALVCPAFPDAGRTIYQGHLFVGDRLLSESGMERHPLNPMTDPDLRRWLARQTGAKVGHLPLAALRAGRGAEALSAAAGSGERLIVADAIADADLRALGGLAAGHALVTGGSGIALGLPANFGIAAGAAAPLPATAGDTLVLAGSCSAATRGQIAAYTPGHPSLKLAIGPPSTPDPRPSAPSPSPSTTAAAPRWSIPPPTPPRSARIQAAYGTEASAALLRDHPDPRRHRRRRRGLPPHHRRRRRDLGRRRHRPRHRAAGHRPRDRHRRPGDAHPRHAAARRRAQVRQLRRPRLLRPRRRRPRRRARRDRRPARAALPLGPLALRARPDRRLVGQHHRPHRGGLPRDPDELLPRLPRPGRPLRARRRRKPHRRPEADQGSAAAHGLLRRPAGGGRRSSTSIRPMRRCSPASPTPTPTMPSRRSRPTW